MLFFRFWPVVAATPICIRLQTKLVTSQVRDREHVSAPGCLPCSIYLNGCMTVEIAWQLWGIEASLCDCRARPQPKVPKASVFLLSQAAFFQRFSAIAIEGPKVSQHVCCGSVPSHEPAATLISAGRNFKLQAQPALQRLQKAKEKASAPATLNSKKLTPQPSFKP